METQRLLFNVENRRNPLIPISRFNRGEASQIFAEVQQDGVKMAVKNNSPACILISPEKYYELMELLEDYSLLLESEQRLSANVGKSISHEEILARYGISDEELDQINVEIE